MNISISGEEHYISTDAMLEMVKKIVKRTTDALHAPDHPVAMLELSVECKSPHVMYAYEAAILLNNSFRGTEYQGSKDLQ